VATAIFRFNRSNRLRAIWPVAGQIVTAFLDTPIQHLYIIDLMHLMQLICVIYSQDLYVTGKKESV